jgi:lipid-A-disaccharide synthase
MRLVLAAGETSGDQIGADLARALRQQHPGIELAGLAGPAMQAASVAPWLDMDQLNVMGLSEVIGHLPRLLRLRRAFRRRIIDWQADAFIGIDAPDFNLGLARQLKQRGMTTMHYVSPSVWAWRAGRIPKIARSLDLLLTLYPFEPELYAPHGLEARFVGHHLADELATGLDKTRARDQLGLDPQATVIALLPGSRGGELRRHASLLAETARLLRHRRPEADIVALLARRQDQAVLAELGGPGFEQAGVDWRIGQTRTGLSAADVALAASGTVTLEAFLLGCPLVVFYRLAPGSYWLARTLKLVKSQHVSLPNILTRQSLVPEFIQNAARPDDLAAATIDWLETPERRTAYRSLSEQWSERLARGAGAQAARAILDHLRKARS